MPFWLFSPPNVTSKENPNPLFFVDFSPETDRLSFSLEKKKETQDAIEKAERADIRPQYQLVDSEGGQRGSEVKIFLGAKPKDAFHEFTHALGKRGQFPEWAGSGEKKTCFIKTKTEQKILETDEKIEITIQEHPHEEDRKEQGMKTLFLSLFCLLFLATTVSYADSSRIQNPDNGHWYQRFDNSMTWHDAKTFCEDNGSYLATITSQEENDFVYGNLASNSPHWCWLCWLGATDEEQVGVWNWVTGEPWSFTNWASGEPNHCSGIEYYLIYYTPPDSRAGLWNDLGELNNGGCGCRCPSEYYQMSTICEWGEPTHECTFSISPNNTDIGWEGGSGSVSVTTESNCQWSASTTPGSWDWLGISDGFSGTGTGNVEWYAFANNNVSSRSGYLTIAGQPFTVTQTGVGPDLTGAWTIPLTETCRPVRQSFRCSLKGTFIVSNIGEIEASSSVIRFYLSDNPYHEPEDTQLKYVSKGKLKPGVSKAINLNLNLAIDQKAKDKYVIAVIDEDDLVAEIDETNNQIAYGPIP